MFAKETVWKYVKLREIVELIVRNDEDEGFGQQPNSRQRLRAMPRSILPI
jgi:hypothetical protein